MFFYASSRMCEKAIRFIKPCTGFRRNTRIKVAGATVVDAAGRQEDNDMVEKDSILMQPSFGSRANRKTPKITYRTTARREDRDNIGRLVTQTGFFSADEILIVKELMDERLAKGDESGYFFIFAEKAGRLVGYACFGPIPGTMHSFDLYWIVVGPSWQGRGIGRSLLSEAEQRMVLQGAKRVYIETSSRPQYKPTRDFYNAEGYREEAFLADFYSPGDGKIVFVKAL
jgi:GNAT superfamily N-acetyltransferase